MARVRDTEPHVGTADRCDHWPEAHVVWDAEHAGYRGATWCLCREVEAHGRHVRSTYLQALDDSTALTDIARAHGARNAKSKGRRLEAEGPGR